ncbi:MAG: diguanylate cyclase [Nitrospinae bacterium]|nr:diguanylate cyclase [Nitrospinota bacterium]
MIERRGKKRHRSILLAGFGQDKIHPLKNALEASGYKISGAVNSRDALKAVSETNFDLVIVDEETPEMPGISFAAMLKATQATRNTPIAIVSYSYSEKIREDGFKIGIIGFLHSPFTEGEAVDFVDSLFFSGKINQSPEIPRILAVEDSLLICKMYKVILAKHGYDIRVEQDPLKAEEVIKEYNPHLILMDANMPGMDGFELTRRIKADKKTENIRVIMVTGDTKKQSAVKALDYGAVDFLTKPFDEDGLLARMRAHLNNKRLFDDLTRAYHELRSLNDRLELLSITDGLTGLFNHRYFHEELNLEMERALSAKKPLSLTLFDIDHFKKFNDTHGHKAGDAVLQAVGDAIKKSVGDDETAARYGGEEFAIIMPGVQVGKAMESAERLRRAIEVTELPYGDMILKVTVSIGVAMWDGKLSDHRLIELADKALYESKKGGRNRVTAAA